MTEISIDYALQVHAMKLALGTSLYDPADPMGKIFFNVLAIFTEFEGDLIPPASAGRYGYCTRKGNITEKI